MESLSLPALVFCVVKLHRLRSQTGGTTAEFARRWGIAAILACIVSAVLRAASASIPVTSAVHYFAAVMLLTPFITILGARRPGANAWPWFVVLPLLLVLQWPSVSQLSAGTAGGPIAIPTPTVIAFLFVLTMGAGNYFGTLNTGPMLAVVVGTVAVLAGVTEAFAATTAWTFTVGCWFLALGALLVRCHFDCMRNNTDPETAHHIELWQDFRDLYGIVWAKRVMDRVNQFAQREDWPIEMSLDGFQLRESPTTPNQSGTAHPALAETVPGRAVEILCWILRRFVNRDFLRRYLPESSIPSTVTE